MEKSLIRNIVETNKDGDLSDLPLEEYVSNCCSAPVDEFEICQNCKEPCEAVLTE